MREPTYLNLDLGAQGVQVLLDQAVVDDEGQLSLAQVHGAPQPLLDNATLALEGAASIGVAPDGDVYVADAAANRVMRVPGCGGEGREVGCLSQALKGPRGVLVGPRDVLYVADSGNGRVLLVDLVTEQLRGVWGGFAEPWDLAADSSQRLYVVDHGHRALVRLDVDGRVDTSFSLTGASTVPRQPESVLTTAFDGEEFVIVFDRASARRLRLLVYTLDGAFAARQTRSLRTLLGEYAIELLGPSASANGVIYIAEAGTGRVLSFDLSGRFIGSARWFGAVSALGIDAQGRLLIGGAGLIVLDAGRPAAQGTFRVGPVSAPFAPPEGANWQLLRARIDLPLPPQSHLQLFAWTSDDPAALPPPIGDPAWHSAPVDSRAWWLAMEPAPYLWVGGQLTAGGEQSPLIRGLQVEFDREGWLAHLPAIYARESGDFLEPALAAFEDALRHQEELIENLPVLFDPAATPADDLDWLAGWLAYDLDESFDEQRRRDVIKQAFALQGLRGTAESLLGAINLVLGVDARIVEPGAGLQVWQLGQGEGLGFGTVLGAGEPDGAIVGTTAELGSSNLQADEDFGAPLFNAAARRFSVQVYGSDLDGPAGRTTLERLVDRGRPAETEAHVCVIEARLRVGFQATVGLDAVVGRRGDPMELGNSGLLGAGAALKDEPERLTLGPAIRLGSSRTLI